VDEEDVVEEGADDGGGVWALAATAHSRHAAVSLIERSEVVVKL
jgi:hypothetical protein